MHTYWMRWQLKRIVAKAVGFRNDEYWGGEQIHRFWQRLKSKDKRRLEDILLKGITFDSVASSCGYFRALELINSPRIRRILRSRLSHTHGCTSERIDIAQLLCLMHDSDGAELIHKLLTECKHDTLMQTLPIISQLWRVDPEMYIVLMSQFLLDNIPIWEKDGTIRYRSMTLMNDFILTDIEIVNRLYSRIRESAGDVAHLLGTAILQTVDRPREILDTEDGKVQAIYTVTREKLIATKDS